MVLGSITSYRSVFQSTPPRGRRPRLTQPPIPDLRFNPRLREGGDGWITWNCSAWMCFNPRLREGGDCDSVMIRDNYMIGFNPRLREGGDA